jgi:amidase
MTYRRPEVVDSTRDDALGDDDATALEQRLARRDVSPTELRAAAVERASAAHAHVNAVTAWVDPMPAADLSRSQGPLAGIPSVIKDNENLAGYPTTHGSLAVADRPADASSPWVSQFLALGAVPIAKTTLPEFGLTASTESSRFGATRNPWNTAHTVGGSSGGSAALVAAGAVPMAHANDGGGSTRIPAACCGLVGLKPSRGRLVDWPAMDRVPVPIVVQSVLTRSVRDTALYLAAAERLHRDPCLPEVGHVTAPASERLRVAVVLEGYQGLSIAPDTQAVVAKAAATLAALGHYVEEVPSPVDITFARDFLLDWAMTASLLTLGGRRIFGPGFDAARTEPFTRFLVRRFRSQVERTPFALRRLRRLAREHEPHFRSYDLLVTPVLNHAAPPIGYLGADIDPREHLIRLLRFMAVTPVQNVSGSPAISLPLGLSDAGLPVGVQLAAPFGLERRLLQVALQLEEALPWPTRPIPMA